MRIHSEQQYVKAKKELEENEQYRAEELRKMQEEGYTPEMIGIAFCQLDCVLSGLRRDVREYEDVVSGNFDKEKVTIDELGSHLIKLRIWKGLSQTELAERLGVSPAQVCKDEKNEYQNISMRKLNRILQALHVEKLTIIQKINTPTCNLNKRWLQANRRK
ncbi:helix-turn-helix domain-containing protein [Thermoflavimicrobium dichotomicum]|uniref:helix-turn-helix domain-containing protein n=1 Tax=Thermoflavimicrobium dichotomicum TaxID=46223 RepID=UPI0015878C7F|nr:helix-turn-helix transcriptional regulator [Thermoflavimicrobium dichotomicum]